MLHLCLVLLTTSSKRPAPPQVSLSCSPLTYLHGTCPIYESFPPRATKSSTPQHFSSGCVQSSRPYHTWYKPKPSQNTPNTPVHISQRIPSNLDTQPADPLLRSPIQLPSTTNTLSTPPNNRLPYGCRKDTAHGGGLEGCRSYRRRKIGEISEDGYL